jgi:hypothetical protein
MQRPGRDSGSRYAGANKERGESEKEHANAEKIKIFENNPVDGRLRVSEFPQSSEKTLFPLGSITKSGESWKCFFHTV